ncbi:hypothetical protein [Streptomyces sp. NPDC004528]|uniref:hypothetical protein n=1 Tax=Streptomyces sp. NPDC004528 TaxID=3154550 RepID=UPI0033B0B8A9
MGSEIVRRTGLFGKSYMWVREDGRLVLRPDFTQRWLFSGGERNLMKRWRKSGQLANTGRPSRTSFYGGLALATVTTAAALSTVLSVPTPEKAPKHLSDVATAPVVTPSPTSMAPYRPEPRRSSHTAREGVRATLKPSAVPHIVKPSRTSAKRHPIATAPADIRITYYRNCSANPQPCIDAGSLTFYAGRILAGHNYMGYQWLSRVPVGRTVRVISGPMAGTYRVYGHLVIGRQGGAIPAFAGSPALVLQTCEGSGTGFSLLHRV